MWADGLVAASQSCLRVVPLAHKVCLVAVLAQPFPEQWGRLDPLACVPEREPGDQHRAAGNTNGTRPGTLVVRVREGRAPRHELVQVRGLDLFIEQEPVHHVVHEDQANIGLFHFQIFARSA